jgi:hypothetical protein
LPVPTVLRYLCISCIRVFSEEFGWCFLTWSYHMFLNQSRSSICPENHNHGSSGGLSGSIGLNKGALALGGRLPPPRSPPQGPSVEFLHEVSSFGCNLHVKA